MTTLVWICLGAAVWWIVMPPLLHRCLLRACRAKGCGTRCSLRKRHLGPHADINKRTGFGVSWPNKD